MYTIQLSERGVLLLFSALMSFKFSAQGDLQGAGLCASSAIELLNHLEPQELESIVRQLELNAFDTPVGREVLHQDTGLN